MALGFRKFISEMFVNGKFPKILPSENFPLYGSMTNSIVYMQQNDKIEFQHEYIFTLLMYQPPF